MAGAVLKVADVCTVITRYKRMRRDMCMCVFVMGGEITTSGAEGRVAGRAGPGTVGRAGDELRNEDIKFVEICARLGAAALPVSAHWYRPHTFSGRGAGWARGWDPGKWRAAGRQQLTRAGWWAWLLGCSPCYGSQPMMAGCLLRDAGLRLGCRHSNRCCGP